MRTDALEVRRAEVEVLPPRRPDTMEVLREWRLNMDAKGLSPKTQEQYVYSVWRMLWSHIGTHVLDFTPRDVDAFLAGLSTNGGTKYQTAKGVRAFYTWAEARKLVEFSPVLSIPRKPTRKPPEALSPEQVTAILHVAWLREPRRALAIQLCYSLGLRLKELCNLRCENIDLEAGAVHVRVTKGDRPRRVEMGPLAREAAVELLRLSEGSQWLFPARGPRPESVGGTHLHPATFAKWMQQAATDLGLPVGKKRRTHVLRASFATHLLNRGVPVSVVSQLLGHSDVQVTTYYLAVEDKDRRAAVSLL